MSKYIYIVTTDSREGLDPILSVRGKLSDAYLDANKWTVSYNNQLDKKCNTDTDEDLNCDYKTLSPKDFYNKYNTAWFTSADITKKKLS